MASSSLGIASRAIYRNLMQNHFELNKYIVFQCNRRLLSNNSQQSFKSNTNTRPYIKGVAVVVAAGSIYMMYDYMQKKKERRNYMEPDVPLTIGRLPKVPITRKIVNKNDPTDLDLVLFECQTCPFCCKMLAYLDSKGFSYSVVDIDEPFERNMKWSKYKIVPCVLARTKKGEYIELSNSSVIISILSAILNDPQLDIEAVAQLYPKMSYINENGHKKHGIVNKYEVMYFGKLPKGVSEESMKEEYRWRDWADHRFLHSIYPNIYRTYSEALDTYTWFSELSKWDEEYSSWFTKLMIHAGAAYMFLISKRLKKKHNLSDDVRGDFYGVCNKWTNELDALKTQFHGGDSPDLADLAVYGALISIEGCQTFKDLMDNTKIEPWFIAMKQNAEKNRGTVVV